MQLEVAARDLQHRKLWIDEVKLFACALVVIGHLLQSVRSAGIVADSGLLIWFDHTIYFIHVPLFFICSGFLQQTRKERTSQRKYCFQRCISLGLPYLIWSVLMWTLKQLFEGAVNNPHRTPLLETLILEPISPYWYLYVLLLFTCFVPVAKSPKGKIALLGVGIGIHLLGTVLGSVCGIVSAVAENLIWYMIGIVMPDIPEMQKQKRTVGLVAGGAFFCGSILVYFTDMYALPGVNLLMGLCGCCAIICIFQSRAVRANSSGIRYARWIYPVYMLHTFIAAPARIVLQKLGIQSAPVHIMVGLFASFGGPILYGILARKLTALDCLLYPQKYLVKVGRRK